jgi:hypothetical protein
MATATGHAAATEALTHRRDAWWAFPLLTFVVYIAFIVYATYRVFEPVFAAGTDYAAYRGFYEAANGSYYYASPFGTPDFTWAVPSFLYSVPFLAQAVRSPAFLILPFPAGFRFTCYYYRKSYYRAFTLRPAACAVPAVKGAGYRGERGLLVLQNLHRYFLYAAIVITAFLGFDAFRSIVVWGDGVPLHLYFGIGSAFMVVNVTFLVLYSFGCHSWRHLVGGKLDEFTCDPLARFRYGWWSRVTMLNQRHALWAWLSLLTVAGVDVYIRWLIAHPGTTTLLGVPV